MTIGDFVELHRYFFMIWLIVVTWVWAFSR